MKIEVGQEVVINGGGFSRGPLAIGRVEKITPSGQITVKWGGLLYRFNGSGYEIGGGGSKFHRRTINANVEEAKKEIVRREAIMEAAKALTHANVPQPYSWATQSKTAMLSAIEGAQQRLAEAKVLVEAIPDDDDGDDE